MSKLRFTVVHCSGEDPEYPADELNVHSPHTRGWQSGRFCEYPQEIGLELEGGEKRITQVQILSHQSKIATKVEIFLGVGENYTTAKFKRLGYLSLDNNERSAYQARELKTVYIDNVGKFIRLSIHSCFLNKYNLFNQVGIVAVNLLGSDDLSSPPSKSSSPNGIPSSAKSTGSRAGHLPSENTNSLNDLSIDMNLDPETAAKLRVLSDAKARAISTEDYKMAKQIKAVEGELKVLGARLAQLDVAKRQAVNAEDYDSAATIKDQTDQLREEIEAKIKQVHIPGVTDITVEYDSRQISKGNNNRHGSNARGSGSGSSNDYNENDAQQKPNRHSPQKSNKSESSSHSKATPLNVDEQRVGSRNNNYNIDYEQPDNEEEDDKPPSSSDHLALYKKISSEFGPDDAPPSSTPSRRTPTNPSSNRGGRGGAPAAVPDAADHLDRPIVPKEKTRGGGGGGGGDLSHRAAAVSGDHPLSGVPNTGELPEPEDLDSKSSEICEQSGLMNMLGAYRAKCLFSKTWSLREAALKKIRLMLAELETKPGMATCIVPLAAALRTGLDDKIAQVMGAATQLLEDVIVAVKRAKLSRPALAPALDPIIPIIIDKLSDGGARIRDSAALGMEAVLGSNALGPPSVSPHLLKPLNAKQKTSWRIILTRFECIVRIMQQSGLSGSSGLSADSVMNFIKNANGFAHSNVEVRDAAKLCTVEVYKVIGHDSMMPYLKELRKKQIEEYELAFQEANNGNKASNNVPNKKQSNKGSEGNEARIPKQQQQQLSQEDYSEDEVADVTPKPKSKSGGGGKGEDAKKTKGGDSSGGKPNASGGGRPSTANRGAEEGKGDFATCMFCGAGDSSWNEDALDMHYWKDCPLLAPCPGCAQIVEITGLPEHQLDECEQKDSYVPCDVTGLAIRADEMEGWQSSGFCKSPPEGSMCCPLCLGMVQDEDEAWKYHLIRGCPRNGRIRKK